MNPGEAGPPSKVWCPKKFPSTSATIETPGHGVIHAAPIPVCRPVTLACSEVTNPGYEEVVTLGHDAILLKIMLWAIGNS